MDYLVVAVIGPFEAIQYVGTPLALVAFVAAVVGWVYRARLAERRKLIESAPEAERAEILTATIRDFSTVPVENLTREQRFQLASRLIDERAARMRMVALVSVTLAVILATIVLLYDRGEAATTLAVRLHGPAGPVDAIERGAVTLDAGALRLRADVGGDGVAHFVSVPDAAWDDGVVLTATAPGYHQVAPMTLAARPGGGAVALALAPDSTRVRGTVLDDPVRRAPLAGVVLDFAGGVARDTTDAFGSFAVVLPVAAGARVPLRLVHDGRTGFDDAITAAADQPLVVYFAAEGGT